ncbi:cation diffusion facilitator family transporter [Azorhizobium doebereinerae]|uniref:cation diffusion facilitator family transporter n=1 Tax=Azorhizobium doebereinerae TaxID=281091 RepID=UPI0004007B7F|nr:cation transporter [Azorhizobium doebereinerae]
MSTAPQPRTPTFQERREERAILIAVLLDLSLAVPYGTAALIIGSLSMLSDLLRGVLLLVVAIVSWQTLRNLHRGRVAAYEYGIGKLERGIGLMVGVLLIFAAGFIAYQAVTRGGGEPQTDFWAWVAIVMVVYNFIVNAGPIIPLWQANRAGGSMIVQAQLRAHIAKAVASFPVVVCVIIDSLAHDPVVARTADSIGGLVGAAFMTFVGVSMVRASLPDLLDRALSEPVQLKVNRTLAAFFHEYDALLGIRTRRSGNIAHVEITVGFDPTRSMADVSDVLARMEKHMETEIPDVDAVLIARAHGADSGIAPRAGAFTA